MRVMSMSALLMISNCEELNSDDDDDDDVDSEWLFNVVGIERN